MNDRNADEEMANALLEREQQAIEALNRCAKAGADPEALKTLARECGINVKHITIGESK